MWIPCLGLSEVGTTATPPWGWCAKRTTGFHTTCESCAFCCRVWPFPALGTNMGIPAPLESTLVSCQSVKKATDFNQSMCTLLPTRGTLGGGGGWGGANWQSLPSSLGMP